MKPVQTNWDARAAINFMGGGAGAGLLIATALLRHSSVSIVLATFVTSRTLMMTRLEAR